MKPFIAFIPVQTNVPILERKIFNEKQDLLMLYDLCHGVSTGIIDQVYVLKKLPEVQSIYSVKRPSLSPYTLPPPSSKP